jgi:hypothetical protein
VEPGGVLRGSSRLSIASQSRQPQAQLQEHAHGNTPTLATMAAAPTFCSEYSAFVEGVVKGARKFLENKSVRTTFSLPDLPVSDHAESGDYNLRRIGLLVRLIDRMVLVSTRMPHHELQPIDVVQDEIIVPTPKSTPTTRDHYLFHDNFDSESGFGKLTGTAWIKAFWNGQRFDQAADDAMSNIERFLNREIVSQGGFVQEVG